MVVQWLAPHLKARRSRFKSHLGPLCVEFALVLPQPGWHLLKEVEDGFFGTFLCGIQTYGHSRSAISFVTANQSGHPADAVSHQPGGMLVLFPQRVSCLYRVAFIHPGGESSPGVLPFTFPYRPVAG